MDRMTAVDHSDMRERNLAVILNTLHHAAPISRAGIARVTGLNKATVTSLTKELADTHFIRELEIIPSDNVGRPATGLGLDPQAGSIISIEIGVDFISAIVTDFTAKILWRHSEETVGYEDQTAVLGRSFQIAEEAYQVSRELPGQIFGMAWGIPGLVDVATGTLLFAPNLGWNNVPLRQMAESKFHVHMYVDNEANLAALGEAYFGSARGQDQILYVSSGVGLGGGIVINGELLSGASGFAGEIGHMTMDLDGTQCNCGNYGCWETLASQWALFRKIRQAVEAGAPTSLSEPASTDPHKLTVPLIVAAAQSGDTLARKALRETGQWLGVGIANLVNAFNPHHVVFGGKLSLAEEFLVPEIQAVVEERALKQSSENCEILVAEYGADGCVMGGVAAVYRATISQLLDWTS